jgi:hypothetical protein
VEFSDNRLWLQVAKKHICSPFPFRTGPQRLLLPFPFLDCMSPYLSHVGLFFVVVCVWIFLSPETFSHFLLQNSGVYRNQMLVRNVFGTLSLVLLGT